MPSKQGKNFTFTLFPTPDRNPDYQSWIDDGFAAYVAYGEETCPSSGRFHHQGFLHTVKKMTEFAVRKKIGGYASYMNGTIEQNEAYCSKASELTEYGTKPRQGARLDLSSYVKKVHAGELSINQILIDDPISFHQYGRTLQAAEDAYLIQKKRTEMTIGIWLYGPTGSGKSHRALEFASSQGAEIFYHNPEDKGWWDLYHHQPVTILDDFRGSISYSFLLRLVDKYDVSVPRRCKSPIPFTSRYLIVTSALSPTECYHNLSANDSLAQLMRRFHVVFVTDREAEVSLLPSDLPAYQTA